MRHPNRARMWTAVPATMLPRPAPVPNPPASDPEIIRPRRNSNLFRDWRRGGGIDHDLASHGGFNIRRRRRLVARAFANRATNQQERPDQEKGGHFEFRHVFHNNPTFLSLLGCFCAFGSLLGFWPRVDPASLYKANRVPCASDPDWRTENVNFEPWYRILASPCPAKCFYGVKLPANCLKGGDRSAISSCART